MSFSAEADGEATRHRPEKRGAATGRTHATLSAWPNTLGEAEACRRLLPPRFAASRRSVSGRIQRAAKSVDRWN
ncbi:MAG: hypothetical protein QOK07_1440 [Gemmatimonadaceae bacterium]|nr:hypothetical protein [Gemmatimonadaceae bacterium]